MARRRPFVVLDIWETVLVVVMLLLAALWGATHLIKAVAPPFLHASATEREVFEEKYGPDHFSEREEEWLIRDFFGDKRDGVFVDIGANHFRAASKTYYLESKLGWRGIAVEPQKQFAADYEKFRPKTKFLPFFVSDTSNETAKLYVTNETSLVASADKAFVERFGKADEVREVPTITLTDLFTAEKLDHVDFLSIDIELHEPYALRGFDIKRFKPSLVCIEGLSPVRQQILDYFARNGYALVGKYMWVDLENMYFAPLPEASALAAR